MAEKARNHVAIARAYAGAVVAGEIPACKWTIKACERQLEDLKKQKSKEWPYKFDHESASRICRFIEKLPHIKGDWAKNGGRIRLVSPPPLLLSPCAPSIECPISQNELAGRLGVTFAAYNRWMNEKAVPRKKAQERIDELYRECISHCGARRHSKNGMIRLVRAA
jgi:hypothetical protein